MPNAAQIRGKFLNAGSGRSAAVIRLCLGDGAFGLAHGGQQGWPATPVTELHAAKATTTLGS
jgi:hypothetical protein